MYAGIWEIDLHGKNEYQARVTLDAALRRVRPGTYRIRVIHGHHGGTALRELVRREYGRHPQVLRLEAAGPGVTELVLAGAEPDGTGGYVLTFSGYVRDDGVTGAFAGGAPVLAVSLNGGETLEASMAGEGFDGVPHTHTLTQAEAVGRLEGYSA